MSLEFLINYLLVKHSKNKTLFSKEDILLILDKMSEEEKIIKFINGVSFESDGNSLLENALAHIDILKLQISLYMQKIEKFVQIFLQDENDDDRYLKANHTYLWVFFHELGHLDHMVEMIVNKDNYYHQQNKLMIIFNLKKSLYENYEDENERNKIYNIKSSEFSADYYAYLKLKKLFINNPVLSDYNDDFYTSRLLKKYKFASENCKAHSPYEAYLNSVPEEEIQDIFYMNSNELIEFTEAFYHKQPDILKYGLNLHSENTEAAIRELLKK